MSEQYKSRNVSKYEVSLEPSLYAVDLPHGTYKMIDDAFKAWEVRRGFVTEEQRKLGLRGRAFSYGQFKNHQKKQEEKTAPKIVKKVVKKTAKKVVKKKK